MSNNGPVNQMVSYLTRQAYVDIAHQEKQQNYPKLLQKLDELKSYFDKHKKDILNNQEELARALRKEVNELKDSAFFESHILNSIDAYVNKLELHKPNAQAKFDNVDKFSERVRASESRPRLRQ